MSLHPKAAQLAKSTNLVTLVTLNRDGSPHAQMTWVDTDGDHVLINTELHRQKTKNVQRDPRVSVVMHDADNPWGFIEVRGKVVDIVRGPPARSHIDTLAQRYLKTDSYPNPIQSERVILQIEPEKVLGPGA